MASLDPESVREAIKVLGLSSDGDFTRLELPRRYKELMRAYHPDRGGNEEDAKELNHSYDVLRNWLKEKKPFLEDVADGGARQAKEEAERQERARAEEAERAWAEAARREEILQEQARQERARQEEEEEKAREEEKEREESVRRRKRSRKWEFCLSVVGFFVYCWFDMQNEPKVQPAYVESETFFRSDGSILVEFKARGEDFSPDPALFIPREYRPVVATLVKENAGSLSEIVAIRCGHYNFSICGGVVANKDQLTLECRYRSADLIHTRRLYYWYKQRPPEAENATGEMAEVKGPVTICPAFLPS